MKSSEQRKFNNRYSKYQQLLVLQGYSKATIDSYSRSIRRLADWCDQCPDERLNKEDFETYFSQLIETHSWSTIKCDRNGIMHYWKLVLGCDWQWIELVKPPKVRHLPDILTPDEITQLLSCVHKLHYRIYLYTVYSLGLRLSEALYLQVGDIDGKLMRVHIREGKGCKDRFVILPNNTYPILRRYWQTHHNPKWLFPSLKPDHQDRPMDKGAVQKAMKLAIEEARIRKHISIHNLRHSYATHSLQSGMDLRSLQLLLGHESPKTTATYTQMTELLHRNNQDVVNEFVGKVGIPSMEDNRNED